MSAAIATVLVTIPVAAPSRTGAATSCKLTNGLLSALTQSSARTRVCVMADGPTTPNFAEFPETLETPV
jgi:hypothetical protein